MCIRDSQCIAAVAHAGRYRTHQHAQRVVAGLMAVDVVDLLELCLLYTSDIFQKAAGRARLRYKFLKPADRSEYKAMLADGQADFVIDLTDDMSQAENYGYKLTDSYLSA